MVLILPDKLVCVGCCPHVEATTAHEKLPGILRTARDLPRGVPSKEPIERDYRCFPVYSVKAIDIDGCGNVDLILA